jgi:hypothetical protein
MGDGRYAVAAGVLLGALQLIPELGYLLGFVVLLIPLAIGGPLSAGAFALVYIASVKAASTLLEGRLSRGVLDIHPGLLIPGIVVLSQFGAIWLFAAAPFMAAVRDLVRYASVRLSDPPGAAGVLPGERAKRRVPTAAAAAVAAPAVYRPPVTVSSATSSSAPARRAGGAPAPAVAAAMGRPTAARRPTAGSQVRVPSVYANLPARPGARPAATTRSAQP